MKSHAQAVVIGGGVIGCSVLYHLTKLGWTDVMLLERSELTSGSTWHAAAGVHGLHNNNNITKLQYYTMNMYQELEKETGQSCGIHNCGYIYLAQTEEREHQLRIQASKARYFGFAFYELTMDEVRAMHPLVNLAGIRCAFHEPDACHVDPSGVTHAYAKGARQRGAEVHRFTPVTGTNSLADGTWDVITPNGNVHADVVVNVAGLWGREVARLAGFELPLMPLEHMYLVTDGIDEIRSRKTELPAIADRDGEYYVRQEGEGLLLGCYERDCRLWAEEGTPLDFGHELLPDDLERIADNVMNACNRVSVMETAGIKKVINGPMIWSPDSAGLLGPVPELENYFCCNGIIPGFSQSGGLGLTMAQWIINGEPEFDMFAWDMARFDTWADKNFTTARAMDCYSHRFKIHFPYEERESGRGVRTRPLYEKQKAMGAVFGLNSGWEHPLWFAGEGHDFKEEYGYTRQNWFEPVGKECRALRNAAGIIDISNFAKYEIRGKGAAQWLDRLMANRIPTVIGRSCLTPLISVLGGIAGDFTITKLADEHFMMFGSGPAERFHKRYFNKVAMPDAVSFASLTESHCGINIAGPKAREVLQRLAPDQVLSPEGFRFMRSRRMKIAGVCVLVLRVSFSGDLGYEIYMKEQDQIAVYHAALEQGSEFGLVPVGSRSLLSLRIEKGYGSWGREYSTEYWPQESGMERLIKLDKEEGFLHQQAYEALKDHSPRHRLVSFVVETPHNADAVGGEPIFTLDGQPAGQVTSGAYGYSVDMSLALGYLKPEYISSNAEFDISILGIPHRARLLDGSAFDPKGERLRG